MPATTSGEGFSSVLPDTKPPVRASIKRLDRRGYFQSGRVTHRTQEAEHVAYRFDADCEEITFHSFPHGCTGYAVTLDDARKAFRASMIELLVIGRRELPRVVEHLEAIVDGIWVRTKVGAVHRDLSSDKMFLQTLLAEGAAQDALRHHLQGAVNQGATPVVVIVEPGETLGSVLDQMSADDVLVVAHADPHKAVRWVALYGPCAIGADEARQIADQEQLRTTTIEVFTHTYGTDDVRPSRTVPKSAVRLGAGAASWSDG
jgi:hypothetical protein